MAPEEREARHQKVLIEGAKAVAIAGPAGLAASLLAQRNWRFYQRLSLPFKVRNTAIDSYRFAVAHCLLQTFIGLMIPTAAFFTVTGMVCPA